MHIILSPCGTSIKPFKSFGNFATAWQFTENKVSIQSQ